MNGPLRMRVCPECVAGKCRNCNGDAWDQTLDRIDVCDCDLADHKRCAFCGDPLLDPVRECDLANHCTNCRMHCEECTAFNFDVRKADWYTEGTTS